MNYDPNTFTWGSEFELGDVPKSLQIPPEIGCWEYSETDIVNLREPWHGIAVDPKGINPPVGGEVNLRPSKNIHDQVQKISDLLDFFRSKGHEPTTSFISHTHVHTHIPGLTEDPEGLKRLTAYIKDNQEDFIREVNAFQEVPGMCGEARTYLKYDGGRLMPDWLCDNLIQKTTSLKSFIDIQCCGKDGVSRGRPIRYAINTYCLKHTQTIEMRLFRASLNIEEVRACFEFTQEFLSAALNDGPSVMEILKSREWNFPKFSFDPELWASYKSTKQEPGGSAGKNRKFWTPV